MVDSRREQRCQPPPQAANTLFEDFQVIPLSPTQQYKRPFQRQYVFFRVLKPSHTTPHLNWMSSIVHYQQENGSPQQALVPILSSHEKNLGQKMNLRLSAGVRICGTWHPKLPKQADIGRHPQFIFNSKGLLTIKTPSHIIHAAAALGPAGRQSCTLCNGVYDDVALSFGPVLLK